MSLTAQEELEYIDLLEAEEHYQAGRKLWTYFQDTGPLRRAHYPKHMEFFAKGATHQQRLFLAANRVGKTLVGCIEVAYHMSGLYPDWWEGKRFDRPISVWIVGTRAQTVRDILQATLLGPPDDMGTGVLPRDTILRTSSRMGIADAIEIVRVRHSTGGVSSGVFKSYDQGRKAFEGTAQDVILEDEEPPLDVHAECLLRLMTTHGLLLLTFTPLQGMSDTVMQFLPDGQLPDGPQTGNRYVVNAGWDDAPHLTEAMKASLLNEIPPFQRDARTKGFPQLGAGLIYPVPEDGYLVDDFPIPAHYLRAYGMDVGWNRTACLWGAFDPDTHQWYLYHEHYRSEAEPSVHAEAIRAPGAWIHGVIDPAARGRSQADGTRLIESYRGRGLKLTAADNAVETGLYEVWERLSGGRLKVFRSLQNWQKEARLYRRDDKGRVVKEHDHLMDATRYLIMSGRPIAKATPVAQDKYDTANGQYAPALHGSTAWMG